MINKKGIFIVVEGIDGAGKTTLTKALKNKLENEGLSVVLSREPTNGPHGQKIREFAKTGRPSPEEELQAFINDRKDHVSKTIRPSLKRGDIVLLDRYYYSTMAYQGARGISMDMISQKHRDFIIDPDLLVLLDIEVEDALARASNRGELDEFEKKDYLQKVSDNYKKLEHPNVLTLDATATTEDLVEKIWLTLLDMGVKNGCLQKTS